jgi:hypothetical protein
MISPKHGPGGIACCGLIVACCQPLAQCPWAAPAQSLEFVTTWYEVYREGFSLVLVSQLSPDGMLIGALPLAVSRDKGRLVVAGAHQGEYKTWISLPTDRGGVLRQEFRAGQIEGGSA